MKTQKRYPPVTGLIVATGLVLFVGCGAAAWLLSSRPFGPVFNTLALAAAVGLVAALVAPGFRLVRSRPLWKRAPGLLLVLAGTVVATGVLVLKFDSPLILCRGVPSDVSPAQWTEDLHFLADAMENNHPDLFSLVEEKRFRSRVAEIEARIPELDDITIKAELAGLVAMANDAHSFPDIYSFSLDWHIYPLHLYWFDDGVFVTDAGRELGHLVGTRLVAVGGEPVETVSETMRRYLSAENEWGWRDRFGRASTVAEWLYAAGLARDRTHARFAFEDENGNRIEQTLEACHYIPVMYWGAMRKVASDAPPPVPNERIDNYRFEYLPSSGTLYLQLNQMQQQQDGEPVAAFVDRLRDWVDTHEFERFVVDLRVNDGGNEQLFHALAELIATHEKINRENRLFGITGHRTFSAAVMFASYLSNTSKILMVGEPTGQGPILFGGPRSVELPNSKQRFLISSHLARADIGCAGRPAIVPDIRVPYRYVDFASGRDPSMEAIVAHSPGPSGRPVGTFDATGIEGRYFFSPYQALLVDANGARPRVEITDFVEGSLVRLRSQLYPDGARRFRTDVGGVSLVFPVADGESPEVRVVCGGDTLTAKRAPDGYRFPLERIEQGDIEGGAAALLTDRGLYTANFPHLEGLLNAKGYELLREQRAADAVALFRLNAELYPQSSNVYDSLGEGLMTIGENESAIENYERSLQLNPGNANARAMLEKLRGQSRG